MRQAAIVGLLVSSLLCSAQQVHVSATKGGVALTVLAQKPYELMGSEQKMPSLTVQCAHKGKKSAHLVIFSPGGTLADSDGTAAVLKVTVDGKSAPTRWVVYGSPDVFTYYGSTEAERVQFLQIVSDAKLVSIAFSPFLTGIPVNASFDVSRLKDELAKHPECAIPEPPSH